MKKILIFICLLFLLHLDVGASPSTAKMLVDGHGFVIPNQYYDSGCDCYIVVSTAQGIPTSGGGSSGGAKTGLSTNSTYGTSSSTLAAAAAYSSWLTINNTSTANTIYISFNATATMADLAIPPGGALTLPFGNTNALTCIASASGTTYSIIGS